MMIRKLIGYSIILLMFVVLAILLVIAAGWLVMLISYGITFSIAGLAWLAAYLIVG